MTGGRGGPRRYPTPCRVPKPGKTKLPSGQNAVAPSRGRRCAMEYFHYVSTLDYVLLGFIALLVFWNLVEASLRR